MYMGCVHPSNTRRVMARPYLVQSQKGGLHVSDLPKMMTYALLQL